MRIIPHLGSHLLPSLLLPGACGLVISAPPEGPHFGTLAPTSIYPSLPALPLHTNRHPHPHPHPHSLSPSPPCILTGFESNIRSYLLILSQPAYSRTASASGTNCIASAAALTSTSTTIACVAVGLSDLS